MTMELDELLKDELNQDSPDFTAEEAEAATDTTSEDDFAAKAAGYLKELIANGAFGRTDYQRKKFGGVNYSVLCFGGYKKVFKVAWLS
jgi:hypothetical protein